MATSLGSASAASAERVDFDELLVAQLRRTPWFAASLLGHVVILLLLNLFASAEPPRAVKAPPLAAKVETKAPEEPPPEPEKTIPPPEVEPPDVEAKEPTVGVADVVDVAPTDEGRESEGPVADAPSVATPYPRVFSPSSAIGLGGGGEPGAFAGRAHGRSGTGTGGPGSPGGAVTAGLEWLRRHQSPEGLWDCDGFSARCDPAKGAACGGKGGPHHDVGVTGLALLAFLGAGMTHREGAAKATVREGLSWLRARQDADGCFGERTRHFTYGHAIATLAMCEAYGLTGSAVWKRPAQRGIDFIVRAQNPYRGWRYDVRPGDDDVSVTAWMVMALKSAKLAGLEVPDEPLRSAHAYIKAMTDDETGRTGYVKRGERPVRPEGLVAAFPAEESESLTAAGMLVRIFCDEDPAKSPAIKAGSQLLMKRLPQWAPEAGKVDQYYWYYGTLAMFQIGGPEWSAWNAKMLDAVVKTQRTDGDARGSWDPVDPWGEEGGRVYATAMLTMCLEVYYRYGRVFGTR